MAESILARADKLTSDLNRLEASMAVNDNGNDGLASPPKNGIGSNVECDNDIYNMSDKSVSNNAVLSMSDLMDIVKRQQSLIVDMAAISMKNAASTTANISMATATTKQPEDTAAIKLQQLQHHHRGEDMTRMSDLHLLVSQLHNRTVDVKSSDDNITNGNNNETTTNAKSMMKDHWRVLIVTIGCAIMLALAIGLGARRNTSRAAAAPTSGGSGITIDNFITDHNGCIASCDDDDDDDGNNICTYTTKVDLFASEFGYFYFEECEQGTTTTTTTPRSSGGGGSASSDTMPTIAMELGKTYRFLQADMSNYYHPLGFAYAPDGALANADELDEHTYLKYMIHHTHVGVHELVTLDRYEPQFAWPLEEWMTNGEYYVDVTLPLDFNINGNNNQDLFYFCHIHRYFGGRIKLFKEGIMLNPIDVPILTRVPPPPSDYDVECGTYGLVVVNAAEEEDEAASETSSSFATGSDGTWEHSMTGDYRTPFHPQCPHAFVCETGKSKFATCLEAINCHMFNGMTTNANYDERALFLHQMIPHHQNAVNMAKSLLYTDSNELGYLVCPKILSSSHADHASSEEEEEVVEVDQSSHIPCTMVDLLTSMISSQNSQIQTMRQLLENGGYPEFDICDRSNDGDYANSIENDNNAAVPSEYESSVDKFGYWGYNKSTVDTTIAAATTMTATAVTRNGGNSRKIQDVTDTTEICRTTNCVIGPDNITEICTFTVKLDMYASDLGAIYFGECSGSNLTSNNTTANPYPTIGLEFGKQYIFNQAHITNYYHPLGFAYHPDGAHVGLPELEEDLYLQYMIDGEVVGLEPRQATRLNGRLQSDGSMGYLPLFFHSPDEWWDYGQFSVGVKFDKEDYIHDLFYFCHIHHGMSGRIKLLKDNVPIQTVDFPAIAYDHPPPSLYDQSCGTYELSSYQLPHPECPESFICGDNATKSEFAKCLETMNCYMMAGMTTHATNTEGNGDGAGGGGDLELFLHQMIPHHVNAVNMAKALLKTGTVVCARERGIDIPDDDDCVLDGILREIIGNQNYQINIMYGLLQDGGYPKSNDCVIEINE